MKKFSKTDLIFLLTFLMISLVLMINFDIQIVNYHEDDQPIFYALDYVNPGLFAGDFLHGVPVDVITTFRIWTSLMMLLPAVFYKLINIHPYATTWLITLFQIYGFGCALYYFLQAAGLSKKMAWLGVVFAYPAGLWGWSFTYYGSNFRSLLTPYTEISCLTPLLFSLTCFLWKKPRAGYILLLVAGLIHPTMALYTIGVLTIWKFMQTGFSRIKEFLPHLIMLGLISLIIAAPAFIVKGFLSAHPLPLNELLAGMQLNSHFYPWNYGLHWPPLQVTLIWILLAYLGYRTVAERGTPYTNLWIASLVSGVIFGLSHILSAVIQNPTFMDLIGLRSFSIAVFASLPLVLIFFEQRYASHGFLFHFDTLLFFTLPFVIEQYALSWLLAISLVLLVLAHTPREKLVSPLNRLHPRFLTGAAWVLTGSFCLLFIPGQYIDQIPMPLLLGKIYDFFFGYLYLISDPLILGSGVVVLGLLALVDHQMLTRTKSSLIHMPIDDLLKIGSGAALTIFVVLFVVSDRNPEALGRLDVQEWAKNNTPGGSVFWAPGFNGWRGYSERRRVDDYTRENYAYIYAIEEAKEFRMKMLDFYGLSEGKSFIPLDTDLHLKEDSLVKKLDEQKYRQLATEFDVSYAVLKRTDFAAPNLPLVYQNAYFDIYKVDGR